MSVELSAVEQRYRAVLAVIRGGPIAQVAHRFDVSRRAVRGSLGCYEGRWSGEVRRSFSPSPQVLAPDGPGRRGPGCSRRAGATSQVYELLMAPVGLNGTRNFQNTWTNGVVQQTDERRHPGRFETTESWDTSVGVSVGVMVTFRGT